MALKKCGAAWSRVSKNGKKFLSVDLDGRKLMIFKNERKEKEAHPDYEIFETVDDEPSPRPVEVVDDSVPF
jgi:uncharacterized protein (DUF736 family)